MYATWVWRSGTAPNHSVIRFHSLYIGSPVGKALKAQCDKAIQTLLLDGVLVADLQKTKAGKPPVPPDSLRVWLFFGVGWLVIIYYLVGRALTYGRVTVGRIADWLMELTPVCIVLLRAIWGPRGLPVGWVRVGSSALFGVMCTGIGTVFLYPGL